MQVTGLVNPDGLAKVTDIYPNLEVFAMTPESSVEGGAIPARCFAKSSLVEVTLVGVSSIGDNAFEKCVKLVSISTDKVEHIGRAAFSGCRSLTKAEFNRLTSIGAEAFQDCSSLPSFKIPYGVVQLPKTAFLGCSKMTELRIEGPIEVIDEEFLMGIPMLSKLALPVTLKDCYSSGFAPSVSVTLIPVAGHCPSDSFVVPFFVNEVGDRALKGC